MLCPCSGSQRIGDSRRTNSSNCPWSHGRSVPSCAKRDRGMGWGPVWSSQHFPAQLTSSVSFRQRGNAVGTPEGIGGSAEPGTCNLETGAAFPAGSLCTGSCSRGSLPQPWLTVQMCGMVGLTEQLPILHLAVPGPVHSETNPAWASSRAKASTPGFCLGCVFISKEPGLK